MSLRTKLYLGFGYLMALILVTAASGAIGFYLLSKGIDRILKENFESVQASMEMLEVLEREDSATLTLLLDPRAGREMLQQLEGAFLQSLQRADNNITIEKERPIISRIRRDYVVYRESREKLVETHPGRPLAAYKATAYARFVEVKERVIELLDVNHEAMRQADRNARRTAVRSGAWLAALVMLALVSMLWLLRHLRRDLLSRMDALHETSGAIVAGDKRRRLPRTANDELGLIAAHFNELLDEMETGSKRAAGQMETSRQLLLGMLDARPEPAALCGLDGIVLATNQAGEHDEILSAISGWILQQRMTRPAGRQTEGDSTDTATLAGHTIRLRLLLARNKKEVGWIATWA